MNKNIWMAIAEKIVDHIKNSKVIVTNAEKLAAYYFGIGFEAAKNNLPRKLPAYLGTPAKEFLEEFNLGHAAATKLKDLKK